MKWSVVLAGCLFGLVNCQVSDPNAQQQDKKGLIDWINHLLGGTTTSTTLRPIEDPPENCPPCQCGIARTRRRIVGGHETKKLEFPWMALLMYNGRFYCGATLINNLYVLTAAHCTVGFRAEKITIRFFEHDRSTPNETKTLDRKAKQVLPHNRYNPGTYDNDIALIKLNETVDLSSALKRIRRVDNVTEGSDVESGNGEGENSSGEGESGSGEDDLDVGLRPVCLPTAGLPYNNYTGVVTGWGTTEEGGAISNVLQEVYVPIISNKDCQATAYKKRITENMLCAGEPEGGRDACQGDSGGPLHVLNKTTAQFQEVGVVSWGEGCARPDRPGVYSRVNRYLTWIKLNTRDACYCH